MISVHEEQNEYLRAQILPIRRSLRGFSRRRIFKKWSDDLDLGDTRLCEGLASMVPKNHPDYEYYDCQWMS